jgi:maleate isomerase/arylmalonate decarboxylase
VACVSTALAIVRALRALGVRRVAVATPYHDALNEHETIFLAACGFEVTKLIGLGIGAGGADEYIRIAQTPITAVAAHARAAMTDDAEALLISCTDFPTLPLITTLEAEFARPVISSNSATLWASLRAAGIDDVVPGGGKLLG